jgi:hydrogenase maturation protein HypF
VERVGRRIQVRGTVQGVGFRPFVFRLAHEHALCGWVLNGGDGVRIHVEGSGAAIDAFVRDLAARPPSAAAISAIEVENDRVEAFGGFEIRESEPDAQPTTRISPDLPICGRCLQEMFDAADRRHRYPYINCTECGPRFSILRALPYDRSNTTMAGWPLCAGCAAEYHDPRSRRFHAQPTACASCGPNYFLQAAGTVVGKYEAIARAALLLAEGRIVAVKGIGGYHLACDAANAAAVAALRDRKFRKEQAFAVMVRDEATAAQFVDLSDDARALLVSTARPIVLAPARTALAGVAPDNRDLGVMLPYTPLHHLLFEAGAPRCLVMTSGNRSSEPIAYDDDDARTRLADIADAFLCGERPIARRVDDSVVRAGRQGPMMLRRSRGFAPGAVAALPCDRPILALGGDLKNTITIVVDGQASVSQHIGDLSHQAALEAFDRTIDDFVAMYGVRWSDLTIVHDRHPQYASTRRAERFEAWRTIAVQHHRAHVASVLAERGALDRCVLGVAFDGTGYGDDGAIWGGEFFVGSVRRGFERVAHVRRARLPGGDAAARHPVQAAAGFLAELGSLPDLSAPPFSFPERYRQAHAVLRSGLRTFPTTSVGRLFDTVAALVGFTRPITFEGQAAMWLEHLARAAEGDGCRLPCAFSDGEIDWRETLEAAIAARLAGTAPPAIARAFHRALARALACAIRTLADASAVDTVVLSGGVVQNPLLIEDLSAELADDALQLWTNRDVPPNDGGLSLGQAALAACA